MSADFLACLFCGLAGQPVRRIFRVPADAIGRRQMAGHVRQAHPAVQSADIVPSLEPVDVPLDGPVGDAA